ncbi:DNA repair protein RadA [Alphaproteobacteria bacterium]
MGKSVYICQICGSQYNKWQGKCEECETWNTIIEEIVDSLPFIGKKGEKTKVSSSGVEVFDLSNISQTEVTRYSTGIEEFNRVLGGGIVPGVAVLLYGEPGIGKSTLLLQLCNTISLNSFQCWYISGEESVAQIKIRAHRLEINNQNIKLLATTNITDIATIANQLKSPSLIIIDSIQTMYSEYINSAPGTVSQVKTCAFELIKMAKKHSAALIIVGHITKDGQVAGPKLLEHMVDTVLSFEGENTRQYRIVRAIKNRFGSTNEIGVFEMSGHGLTEVSNPSSIFMPDKNQKISGSCIFAGIEGTRSILVEVQALVAQSFLVTPRRAAVGCDNNRLAMIIAILNARLNLNLMNKEVYLNIAGGLKINEPAIDLAVAIALISAAHSVTIERDTVFFGEIGLLGELRQVIHVESRINEAKKLGFKKIVMPYDKKNHVNMDIEIAYVKNITEIAKILLNNK